MAGFTGYRRTNLDLIDSEFIDEFNLGFFEQGTVGDQQFALFIFKVLLNNTTQYTLTQVDDYVAALDDRT